MASESLVPGSGEHPLALAPSDISATAALGRAGIDAEVWSALMKMSAALGKSELVPYALRGKPADIFVVLLEGHSHGLHPMVALKNINVIGGKSVMSSDLMIGIVKAKGLCEYFRCVESTDQKATYETKRRGDKRREFSFTIDDAKKLGLVDRKNKNGEPNEWQKQPANMLRKRCKAWLARDVYEDLLAGIYDPDEAREFTPEDSVAGQPDSYRGRETYPPGPAAVASPEVEKYLKAIKECGAADELEMIGCAIRDGDFSDAEKAQLAGPYKKRSKEFSPKEAGE